MTHEELLSMYFIYSPPVRRPIPYVNGDNCFNRYTHPYFHLTIQHYVDDDRFVIQNNSSVYIWFNGPCKNQAELSLAIKTGSIYSPGDTIKHALTGTIGFMISRQLSKNNFGEYIHYMIFASREKYKKCMSGLVVCESSITSQKLVLTEKTHLNITQ